MAAEPTKPDATAVAKNTAKAGAVAQGMKRAGPLLGRMVKPARFQKRHRFILYSFYAMVALPSALVALYLALFSADQFQSISAFSVRKQDVSSAISLFGGLSSLSSGTSDNEAIFEFIQSQNMVEAVDKQLDLRKIWGAHRGTDPFFSVAPDASIEDLTAFWGKMVMVHYDSANGSLTLRTRAFEPDDAVLLNQAVLDFSSATVLELSRIAQDDAIRLAREERELTFERLKNARLEIAEFRRQHQIIDPSANYQSQVQIVSGLESQLVETLIERDLLESSVNSSDPRLAQLDRKIAVVRARIAEEQSNIGSSVAEPGTGEGADPAAAQGENNPAAANNQVRPSELYKTVGRYEALMLDQEFAATAYTTALAGLDEAMADAKRKSRYLTAHIQPTVPSSAEYPRRWVIGSVFILMDVLLWILFVLIGYSLRDRR